MSKRLFVKGNEAVAIAAIDAGCRYYFGYPITPQSDIPEYLSRELPNLGGEFIQAESEIGAINMLLGASATGVRAMTSSSGPGISLKQEGISYMAGSELPGVIVDIARSGPGLGGIDASQADYFQAVKGGGHGGYHIIVLAPASVQEMYDLTMLAFDLADIYRMPAMVLADSAIPSRSSYSSPVSGLVPAAHVFADRGQRLLGLPCQPTRSVASLMTCRRMRCTTSMGTPASFIEPKSGCRTRSHSSVGNSACVRHQVIKQLLQLVRRQGAVEMIHLRRRDCAPPDMLSFSAGHFSAAPSEMGSARLRAYERR